MRTQGLQKQEAGDKAVNTYMEFKNLQALRGIGALLVCLFHFGFLAHYRTVGSFLDYGFLGVDMFFIFSGVIMVFISHKTKETAQHNIKKFLFKRLIRILPLYYCATIGWILITHRHEYFFGSHSTDLIRAFLFVPVSSSMTPRCPEYVFPPLFVGWSLNYKVFFYFLFSISFLFKKLKYVFLFFFLCFLVFVLPFFSDEILSLFSSFKSTVLYLQFLTNPLLLFFLLESQLLAFYPI